MHRSLPNTLSCLSAAILLAAGTATVATATVATATATATDSDPTVHQIYEAVEAKRFDQAQQMMDKVLHDHPKSAKAHYVQAELFAKQGKMASARAELDKAEELEPGLPRIDARSVRELRAQVGATVSDGATTRIPLATMGGTLVAPVVINHSIKLDFTVDSGAADVCIPADVFSTLVRTSTVKQSDMTGTRTYRNADGEDHQSKTFVIRSLKIGNVDVENVQAAVVESNGPLLLGQSFLKRFKSWSIDNGTRELVLQR